MLRAQVRAQLQSESDALTRILHEAHASGLSLSEAQDAVLAAVRNGRDDWADLFTDALQTISQQAGDQLIKQFIADGLLPRGTTYDPERSGSQIADALETLPADAAQHVIDTTLGVLKGQLSSALDGGQMTDLIASLQQQYDAWLSGRVNDIADVQVVGDWSLGQLDAAFQAADVTGAQAVRTWSATLDAHTRPDHAEADGQQVGLDEPFDVGGEDLMYPGDPNGSAGNIINCRCEVTYDLSLSTTGGGGSGSGSESKTARRTAYRRLMEMVP